MENPQSIEAVGATVDEAIARGLEALNVTRDQVSVVVLDEGSRGIGGLRPREARVQLTIQEPPLPVPLETGDEVTAREAAQVLQELLDKMRIKAQVKPRWDAQQAADGKPNLRLILDIRGDDLGVLIGRQNETIDALQYLTRMMVARETQGRFEVVVDVEGYKARRENQLKQLALRMAERVASTRKPVALEPMPAHERRIIHIALRDHPSVTTESVGRGDKRKVTLILKK